MIFEIVLLPEPFAPSRPVMRPALHSRFPLDRATTPPNRFLIPVASRTFTLLPPPARYPVHFFPARYAVHFFLARYRVRAERALAYSVHFLDLDHKRGGQRLRCPPPAEIEASRAVRRACRRGSAYL